MEPTIVLFDGVCNFCNGAVDFLLRRDRKKRLLFGSLQSAAGKRLLDRFRLSLDDLDTMVVVEGDRFFARSAAALRIVRRLPGLWPALYAFVLVPRPIRDAFYGLLARRRYRWFGKREVCRVPTPEERSRFLEDGG